MKVPNIKLREVPNIGLTDFAEKSTGRLQSWIDSIPTITSIRDGLKNEAGEMMLSAYVISALGTLALYQAYKLGVRLSQSPSLLRNRSLKASAVPRQRHDARRYETYPGAVPNAWYCVCDEAELHKAGGVLEVRVCDLVLVVWQSEGSVVVQDAFCPHLGANLAVGGTVDDGCIKCPFHAWKFSADGSIKHIPAAKDPHKCPPSPKLKTYPSQLWCGMVFFYFHADSAEPEFQLPPSLPAQLQEEDWRPHLRWDIGFLTLGVVDWVDQAGDHSHFHTLHADFLIPWTTVPIPAWVMRLFPLGIAHELHTYRGDDKEWAQVRRDQWGDRIGHTGKENLYLTDLAGLTWDGEVLSSTTSQTLVEFIGPAIMVFDIPFTLGSFKVFVLTTPTEGGSIMRARTFIDHRTHTSYFKTFLAWILSGISASQLQSDADILSNKIRLKKPTIQRYDGPYMRINSWLKQFYSEGSAKVGTRPYGSMDW